MWWTRLSLVAIAVMLGAPNWLAVIGLAEPALLSSEPPAEGTLPKTQSNVILLTFDNPIELPSGPPLSVAPIGGGQDEGDWFLCSVEPDGVTLKAIEDGPVLLDRTWYRIAPTADFEVGPFTIDLCTLLGDANGSGRVTTADYVEVKAHMGEYTDARYDLNGTGRVTTADYSVVKEHLGRRAPAKPPSGMVLVPAGEFQMGDTFNEGNSAELPVHTVYLSSYYIDIYEVTNQQYATALNWALGHGGLITVTSDAVYQAGSGTSYLYCGINYSRESGITWSGSTFGVVADKEDHPMTDVSWYGAVAYCNWRSAMESKPLCYDLYTWTCDFGVAGYRLPTEAEWEKAAAWDPVQQRHFRFGEHTDGCGPNCLDGHRANYGWSGDPYEEDAGPDTTPVGYYDGTTHGAYMTQNAQSYYGCYDMSGNVWEWCHDWYGAYATTPQTNPTGPDAGTYRVLRGGCWGDLNPVDVRSAFRYGGTPGLREYIGGFRCSVGTP